MQRRQPVCLRRSCAQLPIHTRQKKMVKQNEAKGDVGGVEMSAAKAKSSKSPLP